jgi:NADPH2:quinone reductase
VKAVQVHTPGGPEALLLVDLPEPVAGPGQVRVKVHAIGVGRPDVLIRNGTYKWMPPLPAIPGAEVAGVVDAVGEGVTEFAVGARVLVSTRDLPQRGGCYVESIAVPADAPYLLPDSVSFADAVSLPNLQMAQALLNLGNLQGDAAGAPRALLITGAAGGVATMLAQLARHRGLQTIGTARSAVKREFALANGFDAVVDAADGPLRERVMALTGGRGVDLAFDPIGGALFTECLHCLAPLGTAVSYNIVSGMPSEQVLKTLRDLLGKSLAVRAFSIHTFDQDRARRRAMMASSIALMAAGHVRAPQPTLMPMSEVRQAHAVLDAGQTMGKIVLQP